MTTYKLRTVGSLKTTVEKWMGTKATFWVLNRALKDFQDRIYFAFVPEHKRIKLDSRWSNDKKILLMMIHILTKFSPSRIDFARRITRQACDSKRVKELLKTMPI